MLDELNVLIFVCMQGRLDRSKNTYFRSDPRLSLEDTSTCNGYKGSGYDRGHNAPSGNKQRITLQTNIHTHIHVYTCTDAHTYVFTYSTACMHVLICIHALYNYFFYSS